MPPRSWRSQYFAERSFRTTPNPDAEFQDTARLSTPWAASLSHPILGKLTSRAAALVVFNRTDEASLVVRQAVGGKPDLTVSGFICRGHYRDHGKLESLVAC